MWEIVRTDLPILKRQLDLMQFPSFGKADSPINEPEIIGDFWFARPFVRTLEVETRLRVSQ